MRFDAYEIEDERIVFYSATGQTRSFDREEDLRQPQKSSKDAPTWTTP